MQEARTLVEIVKRRNQRGYRPDIIKQHRRLFPDPGFSVSKMREAWEVTRATFTEKCVILDVRTRSLGKIGGSSAVDDGKRVAVGTTQQRLALQESFCTGKINSVPR